MIFQDHHHDNVKLEDAITGQAVLVQIGCSKRTTQAACKPIKQAWRNLPWGTRVWSKFVPFCDEQRIRSGREWLRRSGCCCDGVNKAGSRTVFICSTLCGKGSCNLSKVHTDRQRQQQQRKHEFWCLKMKSELSTRWVFVEPLASSWLISAATKFGTTIAHHARAVLSWKKKHRSG